MDLHWPSRDTVTHAPRHTPSHTPGLDTVVVLGGSIAGLLAAAASAAHARRVVVIERDPLSAHPARRPGTPQSVHVHGLLASGRAAMEQLVPGLTEDLVAQGALTGDIGTSGPWWIGGRRVLSTPVGAEGLLVSRHLLEAYLRARVRDLPSVTVLDGTDVQALVSGRPGAVTGVLVQDRTDPTAAPEDLDADLVVDATGRPGRASRWFADLGWTPPEEERVAIGVRYRTARVRHRDGDLDDARVVISAATPATPRAGAALRQEDGTWVVTVAGYLEHEPSADPDGLRAFAAGLVAPEIGVLLDREPLDAPVAYRFPHGVRRRLEEVDLPQRYAVLGDAISSVNPIFGQGMSVAALQAVALEKVLASVGAPEEVTARLPGYHRAAAECADRAWTLAVGADLQIAGVTGRRPRGHAAVSAYVRRAQRAAERDPVVARALMRVTALLDPPQALLRPEVAARVLRPGGRLQPEGGGRLQREDGGRPAGDHVAEHRPMVER